MYYYTDVFGLAPGAVGTMFLVARLWDAVNDPLMGGMADRTQTRFGKYRPYLLWMAIPFGICAYLAFANPDFSDSGKLIYAYVTYIGLMMVYTAINVPYSALMGVMTPDQEQRTSLSSYRFVGAFSGGLLISLSVRPLVEAFGGGNEAQGFKLTMALLSTIAVIFFFITFATTKERVKPQRGKRQNIAQDLKILFMNRPWVIMIIAAILTLSNVAVRGAVTIHFLKYFVGDDGEKYFWFLDRTTLFFTTGSIAFITGVFFTGFVSKLFGKRNALMIFTILNGITLIAFYFIPADAFTTMLVVNSLGALLAGPTPALVWAIYTDVADYGEWKFGRRTTALAFSAAMFAQKLGLTIGGTLSGWMLAYYGFVANTAQSEDTLSGIRLMFSIIPGVLAIANGIVLLWYKLSDEELKTIASDLAERRKLDNDPES
jgi:GPH family glycoside/pentoside/hexuronide:cation symporter